MLAWLDLEMTGLDVSRHVIVEIATVLTDDSLAVVAEGPDIIVAASAAELAAMDDFVRDMHTRSGLLAEIQASAASLPDAVATTLAFLREHCEPGTLPLCGNSIGTDRRFLRAHAPDLDAFFHYRSVDVSTVKELCRRWYPETLAAAPVKGEGHRALADVHESIAELAFYRREIFRGE